MAPKNLNGVVDSSLKVWGTANVRVVDASIVPQHIAAHMQSTVYAIGNKVRLLSYPLAARDHDATRLSDSGCPVDMSAAVYFSGDANSVRYRRVQSSCLAARRATRMMQQAADSGE